MSSESDIKKKPPMYGNLEPNVQYRAPPGYKSIDVSQPTLYTNICPYDIYNSGLPDDEIIKIGFRLQNKFLTDIQYQKVFPVSHIKRYYSISKYNGLTKDVRENTKKLEQDDLEVSSVNAHVINESIDSMYLTKIYIMDFMSKYLLSELDYISVLRQFDSKWCFMEKNDKDVPTIKIIDRTKDYNKNYVSKTDEKYKLMSPLRLFQMKLINRFFVESNIYQSDDYIYNVDRDKCLYFPYKNATAYMYDNKQSIHKCLGIPELQSKYSIESEQSYYKKYRKLCLLDTSLNIGLDINKSIDSKGKESKDIDIQGSGLTTLYAILHDKYLNTDIKYNDFYQFDDTNKTKHQFSKYQSKDIVERVSMLMLASLIPEMYLKDLYYLYSISAGVKKDGHIFPNLNVGHLPVENKGVYETNTSYIYNRKASASCKNVGGIDIGEKISVRPKTKEILSPNVSIPSKFGNVSCSHGPANFGYMLQINPYYKSMNKDEDIKKVFNNMEVPLSRQYYQSGRAIYAAVYFNNVNKICYIMSPTNKDIMPLIKDRLKNHMLMFDIDEYEYKINPMNYLMLRDKMNPFKDERGQLRSGQNFSTIDPEIKIPSNELTIADFSGLYSLYFLICLSCNMPDHNGVPITSYEDIYNYFNNVFKSNDKFIEMEIKKSGVTDKSNLDEMKIKSANSEYIRHIQNIADRIGFLFYGQFSSPLKFSEQ